MSNMLPFSLVKEGPLRDIHRIKLMEMIAETIKPAPLMERMTFVLKNIAMIPTPIHTYPLVQPVRQV